jgi:hypothetical protein
VLLLAFKLLQRQQIGLTSNSLKVSCLEWLNALKAPSLVRSVPHTCRLHCGGDMGANRSLGGMACAAG